MFLIVTCGSALIQNQAPRGCKKLSGCYLTIATSKEPKKNFTNDLLSSSISLKKLVFNIIRLCFFSRFEISKLSNFFENVLPKPLEHYSRSIEYTNKLQEPRVIKTHLPWKFLPEQIRNKEKKAKIIYVARNPKDVCISFFKHIELLSDEKYDVEEFAYGFLNDQSKFRDKNFCKCN